MKMVATVVQKFQFSRKWKVLKTLLKHSCTQAVLATPSHVLGIAAQNNFLEYSDDSENNLFQN